MVRVWSEESIETLKGSYLCTDWEVFQEESVDHTVTVITDYMNFYMERVIPTKKYTNDCTTSMKNHYIIQFSDDTVLLALMTGNNDIPSFLDSVNNLVQWCDRNSLALNVTKTGGDL
ncbi:hypothetical protein AAFF_G00318950 [Aldrovandia affinis]|uniref:Uncharacterized protein n=1 Tax=Aldrovandia affinis TaxID=143900 RepID=A0AAD7SMI0_9TELE|nr:hypothetical protein AAFF_G00318950 [Aldrovandia affinis]